MVNLSKALVGLAALVSVSSCTPRWKEAAERDEAAYQAPVAPPVQARQDYGMGWDKEVALYNIDQILKDPRVCNSDGTMDGYADERSFACWDKVCLERKESGKNGFVWKKKWESKGDCGILRSSTNGKSWYWDDLVQIMDHPEPEKHGDYCLAIVYKHGDGKILWETGICTAEPRQLQELKQAIEIYLRERKK